MVPYICIVVVSKSGVRILDSILVPKVFFDLVFNKISLKSAFTSKFLPHFQGIFFPKNVLTPAKRSHELVLQILVQVLSCRGRKSDP